MIGEQHQRAADQVGGCLLSGAHGLAICRCSGSADGARLSIVATTSRMMRAPTMARPSARG